MKCQNLVWLVLIPLFYTRFFISDQQSVNRALDTSSINAFSQSCSLNGNFSTSPIFEPASLVIGAGQTFRVVNVSPISCMTLFVPTVGKYQDLSLVYLQIINATDPLTLYSQATSQDVRCNGNSCTIPRGSQVAFQANGESDVQMWTFAQFQQGPTVQISVGTSAKKKKKFA